MPRPRCRGARQAALRSPSRCSPARSQAPPRSRAVRRLARTRSPRAVRCTCTRRLRIRDRGPAAPGRPPLRAPRSAMPHPPRPRRRYPRSGRTDSAGCTRSFPATARSSPGGTARAASSPPGRVQSRSRARNSRRRPVHRRQRAPCTARAVLRKARRHAGTRRTRRARQPRRGSPPRSWRTTSKRSSSTSSSNRSMPAFRFAMSTCCCAESTPSRFGSSSPRFQPFVTITP